MNIFKKKKWLSKPIYFRNYLLRKTWLDKCLKSLVSEEPLTTNIVNRPKHCWNLNESIYNIYWSLKRQLSWKKSLLGIWKILRFFVNTLAADYKYSLLNRENLTEPLQILLFEKEKSFSQIFFFFCIFEF